MHEHELVRQHLRSGTKLHEVDSCTHLRTSCVSPIPAALVQTSRQGALDETLHDSTRHVIYDQGYGAVLGNSDRARYEPNRLNGTRARSKFMVFPCS